MAQTNKRKIKEVLFGFDIDNILEIQRYIEKKYIEKCDYIFFFERGEDILAGVYLLSKRILKDKELKELIEICN